MVPVPVINAVLTDCKTRTVLQVKFAFISGRKKMGELGIWFAVGFAELKHGQEARILMRVCSVEVHAHGGIEHLALCSHQV